jgi:hypothetical protein
MADVLLVTNRAFDRNEFLCWSYLLQLAGLSVNFWSVQRLRACIHLFDVRRARRTKLPLVAGAIQLFCALSDRPVCCLIVA